MVFPTDLSNFTPFVRRRVRRLHPHSRNEEGVSRRTQDQEMLEEEEEKKSE